MYRVLSSQLLSFLLILLAVGGVRADDDATDSVPAFTRTRDVIYGRKAGLALTMDVFAPKENANGLGIVCIVSGGWRSSPGAIRPEMYHAFLKHGYTVFAVVHGTQPKFAIPDILEDIHRAVRFVRCHARDYHIDPDHLGISGGSAGGHLALMMGTAGQPGDPKDRDPVERVSSRVQAVACFFPPTDFLNWGKPGAVLDPPHVERRFRAAYDFQELDRGQLIYVRVTDEKKVRDILRRVSPITHVSADDAPTLIIHGDKDHLVPLQQSESIIARFHEVGVPAKLIVKKGCDHFWITILRDTETLADWFDQYLKAKPKASQ